MPRPKGSKNLTPEERAAKKPSSGKRGRPPAVKAGETPVAEPKKKGRPKVAANRQDAEPTLNDVLGAISNLGSYVGHLAQEVEQLKSGQVPTSTVVPHGQPAQTPPPVNFAANVQTMQLDNGIDPPPSPELMALVELEGDITLKSEGWEKLQEKQKDRGGAVVPNLGRATTPSRKDMKCTSCGAMLPKGTWVHGEITSFTQNGIQSRCLCNHCLSAGRK